MSTSFPGTKTLSISPLATDLEIAINVQVSESP